MGEVFLDALKDTALILPFLLVMNFLIELIEYKTSGVEAGKILKGGVAPLIGTAVGVVPQCGFSVVATELYAKKKIALGTLLAVYIATSDEALPIMLSNIQGLTKVWPVLVIKICFALIVGYSVFGVEKLIARRRAKIGMRATEIESTELAAMPENEHGEEGHEHEHIHDEEHGESEETVHIHGCHRHDMQEHVKGENETKKQRATRVWHVYFKHPLLHTAEVIAYIFVVNALFGIIVYYVGEDALARFMSSTGYFQPVLAALVGLIPNCAGSVVITELYVVGGLNLGGAVAGLCVSAGIGYAVLIKQSSVKNTLTVMALMFVLSVVLGICITACGF